MIGLLEPVATPLNVLQNQINGLFDDFFTQPTGWATDPELRRYPAVNIWEDGDAVHLEAELPGVKMDDVELFVTGNQLRIAVRRQITAPEKAAWHRQERASGSFSRSFTLPWDLNSDKVQARLKDGVLTVDMPKAEEVKED